MVPHEEAVEEVVDLPRPKRPCDFALLASSSLLLPQVKEKLHAEAISLLKSGRFCNVFDKALVLCQMHDFQDGVLYLYEQGKL